MNSVSRRARFTEPTRENKDVLIRNIRGERAGTFVNEPAEGGLLHSENLKKKCTYVLRGVKCSKNS